MKNKSLLLMSAAVLVSSICGCEGWNQANRVHWEQGTTGAAHWKVNNDRDAQDHILELDRTPTYLPTYDANYEKTAYNAISHLLSTAHPPAGFFEVFNPDRPVLYSTTVDLNDYSNTTNFGRLHAELFSAALIQHWQNDLVKMTLRQSSIPIIPQEGEFLLSRDIQDLTADYNAGAVLVSTYSVSPDKVYLNLQLINVDFNTVVAAVSYSIPLGPRTIGMLEDVEIPSHAGSFLQ